MRVINENIIRPLTHSSVVSIGNFDGVHLGHQALIERCRSLAVSGQEVAVVTFEPLPQAWFAPQKAPARLTSVGQKQVLLAQSGVDLAWMMRFNQQLAGMSAGEFAESVLSEALSASHVVVGRDFRFGRGREGDLALLERLGGELGFEAVAVEDVIAGVQEGAERVSSTAIRKALANGELDRAAALLGRRFTIQGEVGEGSRLGRKLGYPTANLKLEAEPCPLAGVFAVRVRIGDETNWRDAVSSLGRRPAVGGGDFLVEAHLFDFSGDLYGKRLELDFVARIRDEKHFDTMDALVAQMKNDEARAREILHARVQ
jgi:riboflavin kinase/FMN adenylyltransferase